MPALSAGGGASSVILKLLFANFVIDVGKDFASNSNSHLSCADNTSVCYDIYNVRERFSLLPPWGNTSTRPMIQAPLPPEQLDTQFWLYRHSNITQRMVLDPTNITNMYAMPFNPDGKLWVVTHGFRSWGNNAWVKLLVGELLRSDSSSNVVVLNWRIGARGAYIEAVANLRVVARQLAHFLHMTENVLGFPMSGIHLIGHSLGAHLLGVAGTYMQRLYNTTLHRITGLDPASPYHSLAEPLTCLDRSDALFVDVIHSDNTSILGFPMTVGMMDAIGHLDFYPNGGGNQPGCAAGDLLCAHTRATKYFIDSIRQECPFRAIRCPSYEMFKDGECWGCEAPHECVLMGMAATPPSGIPEGSKFFLNTKAARPYCGYQYLVSIGVGNTSAALDHNGEFGILLLSMEGKTVQADPIRLSDKSVYYQSGSTHNYVVLAPDLGKVEKVLITFLYPGHFINPMSWRLRTPRLYLNRLEVSMLGSDTRSEFCFESEEQKSNLEYMLTVQVICY